MDDGFYTTTGIVPATRYFVQIHVPVKEMYEEQKRLVINGEIDFVVSREELEFADKYKLIMKEHSRRPGWEEEIHYIYQRKDLVNK